MPPQQLSLGLNVTSIFNAIAQHYSNDEARSKLFHLPDAARESLEVVSLLIGDDLVGDALKILEEGRITEYQSPTRSTEGFDTAYRGVFSIAPSNKSVRSHTVRLHAWHCDCFEFIVSEASERPEVVRPDYDALTDSNALNWCWGGYCAGNTNRSPPVCAHVVACALVMAVPDIARDRIKVAVMDRFTAAKIGVGEI